MGCFLDCRKIDVLRDGAFRASLWEPRFREVDFTTYSEGPEILWALGVENSGVHAKFERLLTKVARFVTCGRFWAF